MPYGTGINHPWTNEQVERMNRTIKEATVKSFHSDTQEQLKMHLQTFMDAYNSARRLKSRKGLPPHEFICKIYQIQPQLFKISPLQKYIGLYTSLYFRISKKINYVIRGYFGNCF